MARRRSKPIEPLSEPTGRVKHSKAHSRGWSTRTLTPKTNGMASTNGIHRRWRHSLPAQREVTASEFLVADEIRNIEATLTANSRPVAIGIPGYILPMDLDAPSLRQAQPESNALRSESQPARSSSESDSTKNSWKAIRVRGKKWGRARLTITYDDGSHKRSATP